MSRLLTQLFGALLCVAAPVHAATGINNLIVITTVPSTTIIPASENVAPPFSGSAPLNNGQTPSTEVAVPVITSGNLIVTGVSFGDGLYAAVSGSKTAGNYRAMKRTTAADDGTKTNYLGYQLYICKSQGCTASDDTNLFATDDGITTPKRLALNLSGTFSMYVKVKVYEINSQRSGWVNSSEVPVGTYSDTITMTLSY